ncbi:MAG: hypothetical protein ACK480_10990 [Planctomycetota bacterium]|jgi:hypothetical protein
MRYKKLLLGASFGLIALLSTCAFVLPWVFCGTSQSGQFGDTFGFASAVINGLGFLAVVYELAYSSRRARADATIRAFTEANSIITLGELRMRKLSKNGPLTQEQVRDLSNSEEDYRDMWDALDSLHFLAVGLKTGVFDMNVASHLYGPWFSHVINLFTPLIDYAQSLKPGERQFFYSDAKEIAENLASMHKDRLKNADTLKH